MNLPDVVWAMATTGSCARAKPRLIFPSLTCLSVKESNEKVTHPHNKRVANPNEMGEFVTRIRCGLLEQKYNWHEMLGPVLLCWWRMPRNLRLRLPFTRFFSRSIQHDELGRKGRAALLSVVDLLVGITTLGMT